MIHIYNSLLFPYNYNSNYRENYICITRPYLVAFIRDASFSKSNAGEMSNQIFPHFNLNDK